MTLVQLILGTAIVNLMLEVSRDIKVTKQNVVQQMCVSSSVLLNPKGLKEKWCLPGLSRLQAAPLSLIYCVLHKT